MSLDILWYAQANSHLVTWVITRAAIPTYQTLGPASDERQRATLPEIAEKKRSETFHAKRSENLLFVIPREK